MNVYTEVHTPSRWRSVRDWCLCLLFVTALFLAQLLS